MVTDIYQYTRNSMYHGLFIISLSIGFYTKNFVSMLVLTIYVWLINNYQIILEEEVLSYLNGEIFQNYEDQVRRWI